VLDKLDEELGPHFFPANDNGGKSPRDCPACGNGRLGLKLGRFGAFIGCSNYPECRYTRQFAVPGANGETETGPKKLGDDPVTGLEVSLRTGRFGPYLQLGEAQDGEKPKRAGIPKGTDPDSVDLDLAIKLLSLPREVGKHPEDGEPILAGIGRYGPYVQHGKTYANLESSEDVFTIGLNRAVTLIAEKIAKGPRARRFGDPGRELGQHPDRGGPIVVKKGRYGPYVSHDGVNATIPAEIEPEQITLDQAVALIDARTASGAKGKSRRRTAKPAAKKTVKTPAPKLETQAKPETEARPEKAPTKRAAAERKAAPKRETPKAAKKAASKPAKRRAQAGK